MYSLLYTLAFSLMVPFSLLSPKRRRKYLITLKARLGFQRFPERAGRPSIWIHAVSVGEVIAVKSLVAELRRQYPGYAVLVSTTTLNGAEVARQEVEADGFFFFPFDWQHVVRRTIRAIDARVCLVAESELWPNFIRTAEAEGVSLILANGRISDRSLPRYRRFRRLFAPLLSQFELLGAQSEVDGRRLIELGAPSRSVRVTGNLKYGRDQFDVAPERMADLARKLGTREEKTWLVAGSTHAGEEEIVLDAYDELRRRHTGLGLLLVPRKPHRFDRVAALLEKRGLSFDRFSRLDDARAREEVVLVDALGVLMPLYRLARVAFVGGSLIPKGGHNLLEACAAGTPVLFGPHMFNFRCIREDVLAAGAGWEITGQRDLTAALDKLLSNPEIMAETSAAARRVVEGWGYALPRTLELVEHAVTRQEQRRGYRRPALSNPVNAI